MLRYFAYLEAVRRDEHASLRAAFEQGLETQPSHALRASGGALRARTSLDLNPRPDAASRARTAAQRSVELDPTCQQGWRQIAVRCHFERDVNGLRMAAERTMQLNPLSAAAAYMGSLLGYAGDWEHAIRWSGAPLSRTRNTSKCSISSWHSTTTAVESSRMR